MERQTQSSNSRRPIRQSQVKVEEPSELEESAIESAPKANEISDKRYRLYTYQIPERSRIAGDLDPKSITLRELDDDLLDQARKSGHGDEGRAAKEAIKLAIYKVNGKLVNHGDDEASYFWGRWSSKVRHLVQHAWTKIHATDEDEDTDFLASVVVE